jgi:hypothetical protein
MKNNQAPKAQPRQATTAPESLNSFKFTADPWGIPSTAGQMEADFGAREMINARHKQAYDSIDARQASRPDSDADALRRAQVDAALADLKIKAADPFAESRFRTDEVIRAERGRQGVKQEGMNSYLSAVQAEIEAAQKAAARLAGLPPGEERDAKERAIQAALQEKIAALESAHGIRKVTERATDGGGAY